MDTENKQQTSAVVPKDIGQPNSAAPEESVKAANTAGGAALSETEVLNEWNKAQAAAKKYLQGHYLKMKYQERQFLRAKDFQDEQVYHSKKLKDHNRLLHTHGVCEGLLVKKSDKQGCVDICAGYAVDVNGAPVLLADMETVDLNASQRVSGKYLPNISLLMRYGEDVSPEHKMDEGGFSGYTRMLEKPQFGVCPTAGVTVAGEEWMLLADITRQEGDGKILTCNSHPLGRPIAGVRMSEVITTTLGDQCVTSEKIKDGAVITTKIKDGAVTTNKLKDGAVTQDKLAARVVTADKIATNTITSIQLANAAVNNGALQSYAVTEAKIAADAVTEAKLKDGAVTSGKLAANAVSEGKIAPNAVTCGKLAANAVTGSKIAANAVDGGHIANQTLSFDKLRFKQIEVHNYTIGAGKDKTFFVTELDDSYLDRYPFWINVWVTGNTPFIDWNHISQRCPTTGRQWIDIRVKNSSDSTAVYFRCACYILY